MTAGPDLRAIASEFPLALEYFDAQCPELAATGSTTFRVRRRSHSRPGDPATYLPPREFKTGRLSAEAPAAFADLPSPLACWDRDLRRVLPVGTLGLRGYTISPKMRVRAYWHAEAHAWVRYSAGWTSNQAHYDALEARAVAEEYVRELKGEMESAVFSVLQLGDVMRPETVDMVAGAMTRVLVQRGYVDVRTDVTGGNYQPRVAVSATTPGALDRVSFAASINV